MKKIILILCVVLLLGGCVDGATKIGLDRLNWSQSLPDGDNITMFNGSIINTDFITFVGTAPNNTTNVLYVNDSNILFNGTELDQNILSDNVNIKDFGAVGDGITNDTDAFNAALTACKDVWSDSIHSESKTLYIPDGIYNLTPGATIDVQCNIYGPGAVLRSHTNSSSSLLVIGTTGFKTVSLKALEGYYTPLTVLAGEAGSVNDIWTGQGLVLRGTNEANPWIMDCIFNINTIQGFEKGIWLDGHTYKSHVASNRIQVSTIKWCHIGLTQTVQEYQSEDNIIDILYFTGCNLSTFIQGTDSINWPYITDNIYNIDVIEAHRTGSVSGFTMTGQNVTDNQININKILSGASTDYELVLYGNTGEIPKNNSINIKKITSPTKVLILGTGNTLTSMTSLDVRVTNSAGTTIVGSGTTTQIPFATEVYDPYGMWSTDTFVAKATGNVMITGSCTVAAYQQSAGSKYHVYLYKNDYMYNCIGTFFESSLISIFGININGNVKVEPFDELDIRIYKESAGNVTMYTDAKYNFVNFIYC